MIDYDVELADTSCLLSESTRCGVADGNKHVMRMFSIRGVCHSGPLGLPSKGNGLYIIVD